MSSMFADAIGNALSDDNVPQDDFYHFEPWDVEERPAWVLKQASKDGIDLNNDDFVRTGNVGAHPFQTGTLMSTRLIRGTLAATQIGKTVTSKIEAIIVLTGEIPISMRYAKGVDTRIKRRITDENIVRFGRIDKATGSVIDRNTKAHRDGTWDCGNITGCGIYPKKKIAPNGEMVIIGTTQLALQLTWWPWVTNPEKCMFPEGFLDTSKSNNGTNAELNEVYFRGGKVLKFITYESGFYKFESERAWWYHFDEESKDPKCMSGALAHCTFFSISMTPLQGMTYTKDFFFPKKPDPDKEVFHATAYDSPYQTEETIKLTRMGCQPWELGSKIWGMHTSNTGKPYYDRKKITMWLQRFQILPKFLATFSPQKPYVGIVRQSHSAVGGLVDVPVSAIPQEEEDGRYVWRIYEDVERDVAYFAVADAAAGTEFLEDPDGFEHGDYNTCIIMRSPTAEEETRRDNPIREPVIVATIKSLLPPEEFGPMCIMACLYYNGALWAAECGQTRGAHNGIVYSETRDYPWWFTREARRKRSKSYKTMKGIDTNNSTRIMFFDCVSVQFANYTDMEYPNIPDERILNEAAACVVSETAGGRKRPDHPYGGKLDLLIAYGQGLWLFKHYRSQIQWRRTVTNSMLPGAKKSFVEKVVDRINVDSNRKKSLFPQMTNTER